MDDVKLRAWWAHRQGLDGRLTGRPPASILQQTGWARSVGGVASYLTLFSRGGVGRAAADHDVANVAIYELPAARGCTYVLPASDFALGLKAGQGSHQADMKVAHTLGVTDAEIDKLCDAVIQALGKGPLDPEQIRDATGGHARSLGETGKKKGLTTTLPLALGKLQGLGEIRRVPMNGRLDQQRYRYTLWKPNPLREFKLSAEEVHTELAKRFFTWIGPATIKEFQAFAGVSVKAAKAAVEPLELQPLAEDDQRLMLPEDREKLETFQVPKQQQYVLVSSLDGISLLRRDLQSLLAPPDKTRQVFADKGNVELGKLADLPNHGILDRGRIVGLWEYDPETRTIAWLSFAGKGPDLRKAVERTEEFIRTELGDARSFSLDSPKSRAPKIEALRSG